MSFPAPASGGPSAPSHAGQSPTMSMPLAPMASDHPPPRPTSYGYAPSNPGGFAYGQSMPPPTGNAVYGPGPTGGASYSQQQQTAMLPIAVYRGPDPSNGIFTEGHFRLWMSPHVFVNQKVEMLEIITGMETENRYNAMDSRGVPLFQLKERSSCIQRQCCGSSRGFEMDVLSQDYGEIYRFRRECACYFFEMTVTDSLNQRPVAIVKRNFACPGSSFSIYDLVGNQGPIHRYDVIGPCCTGCSCCADVKFDVYLPDDRSEKVGVICKKWSGMVKEAFTDADNFTCQFPKLVTVLPPGQAPPPPLPGIVVIGNQVRQELPVHLKAAFLAQLIMIDFVFYEESPDQSSHHNKH